MSVGWLVNTGCILYFISLFALARIGERNGSFFDGAHTQTIIYALGCCTFAGSLVFYGYVGLASLQGLAYIPIAMGPILLFGLGPRLITRIARLVKAHNITSVADFIGARYGKAAPVSALVATIAAVVGVTFLASQIKVIVGSLSLFIGVPPMRFSMLVAVLIATFAMTVGTRRIDATEHQRGLMLVVAAQALVKLTAFIVVGCYVTWGMFNGLGDLAGRLEAEPAFQAKVLSQPPFLLSAFLVLVSTANALVWPQQFHVTMVENRSIRAIRTTTWFVPVYLILFGILVLPLAIAGHVTFHGAAISRDLIVLRLPLEGGATLIAFFGLLGGLSAVSGMTFVSLIALSIMLSNEIAIPLLMRTRAFRARRQDDSLRSLILNVRRLAILVAMALAYLCVQFLGDAQLITTAHLGVGCMVQITTVCIVGLFWKRATARGAIASLLAGGLVWAYTLLVPAISIGAEGLRPIVERGPFGIAILRPTALFGLAMDPIAHGMMCGFVANIIAFFVFSLTRPVNAIERRQAELFVGAGSPLSDTTASTITVAELESAVARYLGEDATRRSFRDYQFGKKEELSLGQEADGDLLLFGETLIASVVGAATSQLVMSLLLRRKHFSRDEALQLVDQVSSDTQNTRKFFQQAISYADQGMSFFDRNLRLVACNQVSLDIFGIPAARIGASMEELLLDADASGIHGLGDPDGSVPNRRQVFQAANAGRIVSRKNGRIYEARSVRMPDVGIFIIYSDVTDQAVNEERFEAEKETLERRVRERTEELESLNSALVLAKAEAEYANLSKTRFLAAASHDILQPLNAARLYTASLLDRMRRGPTVNEHLGLAVCVGSSLDAVEDILTALLDISRLDAGAIETEITSFHLQVILDQLLVDFRPFAKEKGLRLAVVPSTMRVISDSRMLHRIVQNLVSNAIKYTGKGRIIVGVRRSGPSAEIQVWDTGLGIAKGRQREIFQEFRRLQCGALVAPGIGLGLSIVERLGRALGHEIRVRSKPGMGSVFSVILPLAPASSSPRQAIKEPVAPRQKPLDGLAVAVVDNEPTILSGLSMLLEGWGCTVVTGLCFIEIGTALKARNVEPAVIIADYHLDQSDGIAVIAALRAQYGPCHALLTTADRGSHVRERATQQDIRLLNKPLKPAALRALLSQWRTSKEA